MTGKVTHRRKGTLYIIASLLVASATLRIGAGTGEAFAESHSEAPQGPSMDTAQGDQPEDVDGLLKMLQDRESKVLAREAALADRIQALSVAEAELTEQLFALQTAEQALRDTIALADTAASTDLDRLTAMYENMKPKEAAALFEEMSPVFSAGFLGMMRTEAAALIMSQLTPQTALSISIVLAGRNANVPTD